MSKTPNDRPDFASSNLADSLNQKSFQDEKLSDPAINPTIDPASEQQPELQRWNQPKINTIRFIGALYSFIILGMNDAAYGALLPYLETYYNVNYTIISVVFLAPFIGYMAAAFLNNTVHNRFGQVGVAAIAPLCKIITYVVICVHPPYPVLPVIYTLVGFGNGLEDGGWNAWVGNMQNANELLGLLHGAYGLGATISPLIATALVTKAEVPWYYFYYIMIGLAALEWAICLFAFRSATGASYRAANPETVGSADEPGKPASRTGEALRNPVTWLIATFLFLYTGIEVGLGGWLVTFMLRVRHGQAFESGIVVTGFWLGLTIGRLSLGFITGRIGEKFATAIYLVLSLVLEVLFWQIPSFVSSAIFVAWLGYFLGPVFQGAIVIGTKILPQRLHVSAIGFAAAAGSGGGSVWPFAIGAIAQAKGVQVLQPIVLGLIAAVFILWCLLPGGFKKGGLEEARRKVERRREDH